MLHLVFLLRRFPLILCSIDDRFIDHKIVSPTLRKKGLSMKLKNAVMRKISSFQGDQIATHY